MSNYLSPHSKGVDEEVMWKWDCFITDVPPFSFSGKGRSRDVYDESLTVNRGSTILIKGMMVVVSLLSE